MGMDEHQRDVGIDEQAPGDERPSGEEPEPAGTEPDRIWGADESVGDAESPGT